MKLWIAFLAATSLAAFGCHKNKDGDAIAKLIEFKGKMCACKDKTCSDKVSVELAEWGQEHDKPDGDKPASVDEKDAEKMEAVKEEIASCLLKLEVPAKDGAAGPAGAAGAAGAAAPAGAAGAAGGAGPAGGGDGTMGGGSSAAGSADGSAAAGGGADGTAAGSAAPAAGSAH